MNFKESKEILEKINKASNIIVNLHRSPDPDSYSSAISLYYFLLTLNKEVDICVTNTSELSDYLSEQADSKLIKFVNYKEIDFSKYDLFISPDSASWQQVVDDMTLDIPELPIVVIDHHPTNERFGLINIIQESASSCSEMIYKLFQDFQYKIDKKIANILLAGIIADTGGFAFSNNSETLRIAADLIDLGAD